MMTVTGKPTVSEIPPMAQNEILPSDLEISRRVLRIRAGWSIGERIQRRRDAEQRFVDLMTALAEAA